MEKVKNGTPFTAQISSMKPITNGQLRLKINDGQFENQYVMYAGSKNDDIKPMAIINGKFFRKSFKMFFFSENLKKKFLFENFKPFSQKF